MLFTAKTGGCKISPQLTWRGGYTYGRFCQNQNFLNALITSTASPVFFSWVRTRQLLSWSRLVWMHQRNVRSQQIKSPSDFKILSARKLKTLFQKYKLELTTGIHACIGHASDAREFLKDTTTADSHKNVTWKSEFTFFQSLSWLFQLACFVKCKWTLLELNFY